MNTDIHSVPSGNFSAGAFPVGAKVRFRGTKAATGEVVELPQNHLMRVVRWDHPRKPYTTTCGVWEIVATTV